MTVQQLDEALKAWKSRLSAVAENLLELQTDLTYQSLTGTGGLEQISLTGATAALCGPALRTVHELFRRFGLLQSTVDRAEALRKDLPTFFGTDTRLREAQQLLFARSIEVELDDVPLAERQLDSEGRMRVAMAPGELLTRMMASFAEVRDVVAKVGMAWAACATKLEAIEAEVERVQAQTALPSRLLAGALTEIEEPLAAAREQMRTDPLGAIALVEAQAEPAVARVQERIRRATQVRAEVRAAVAVWRRVEASHAAARAAWDELQERYAVVTPGLSLVDEAKLQGLGEWLQRLEDRGDEGAIEAVAVGLRNWHAAAEACSRQDDAVLQGCRGLLGSVQELRGRVEALAAKAHTRGLAEVEDVRRLREEAEAALRERPLDVARVTAAVGRFERRLRAGAAAPKPLCGVPTA